MATETQQSLRNLLTLHAADLELEIAINDRIVEGLARCGVTTEDHFKLLAKLSPEENRENVLKPSELSALELGVIRHAISKLNPVQNSRLNSPYDAMSNIEWGTPPKSTSLDEYDNRFSASDRFDSPIKSSPLFRPPSNASSFGFRTPHKSQTYNGRTEKELQDDIDKLTQILENGCDVLPASKVFAPASAPKLPDPEPPMPKPPAPKAPTPPPPPQTLLERVFADADRLTVEREATYQEALAKVRRWMSGAISTARHLSCLDTQSIRTMYTEFLEYMGVFSDSAYALCWGKHVIQYQVTCNHPSCTTFKCCHTCNRRTSATTSDAV